MKQLIILQCTLLLALPCYIQAASSTDMQGVIIGSISEPIQTFEPRNYGNSDFKGHDWGLGGLAICRRRTYTATPTNSWRLSAETKRLYDYVYTLRQLECGLIYKHFKDWDLSDIMQVNAWLNRLTDDKPGSLRSDVLPALKLHRSEKDSKRIDMLLSQPLLMTLADKKWLDKAVHAYPHPTLIAARLNNMLETTRESLLKIETDKRAQQVHAEIHVAAYIHLQIGSILPWKLRSEETACILGNLVLMEHGVKPILFDDKFAYQTALYQSIQQNDVTPLSGYMYNRVLEAQEQQAAKLLEDIKKVL